MGNITELKGPSYRQRKAVTIVSGFHVPGFELKPKLGTRNRIEVVHDPARRLLPLGGSREGGSHKGYMLAIVAVRYVLAAINQ